jgi:hypothetical protein
LYVLPTVDENYGFLFIKYKLGVLEEHSDYTIDKSRFQLKKFKSVIETLKNVGKPHSGDNDTVYNIAV